MVQSIDKTKCKYKTLNLSYNEPVELLVFIKIK